MDFRVLGPLEAYEGGRRIALGGPKQRLVLGLLIASGGRTVSVESLIVGVYGEDAAPSAKRTIHTYVSKLRTELGAHIERRGNGYQLVVDPEWIDAVRFESRYREGSALVREDPESASRFLRGALDMWRGHAYADLDAIPLFQGEISRLSELRLAALEERIEADLVLGHHGDLVGELEALIAEHPYRERFRGQHMLALYRSGRQSEALRAFSRARKLLGEELGIDPGRELALLEEQILGHDPSLDLQVVPAIECRAILAADLPDEMTAAQPSTREAALARRDAVLGTDLATRGGLVVGLRGTALYLAVPDMADALAIGRSLAAERMKVAIDFGDVQIHDGDVFGPPLGRSARLVAASHPGQILVSEQAQTALSDSGIAGWSVKSLGRHSLRGVDGPLLIFQAADGNRVEEFPPPAVDRLPAPAPGTRPAIAGYELREPRSSDQFGLVYRAYQPSVGREVTVRVFRPELVSDPHFIRRFEAEGQRLSRLDHPHILPVLDYWREPERAVIVSRSTTHLSLADHLTGSWDSDTTLSVIARMGAALAHAHDAGVMHGALTPSSVVFDGEDNWYLTDFGLAHMTAGLIPTGRSRYTAPEAVDALPSITADVFSLGAIAADMLEGNGRTAHAVETAIEPDPSRRHQTMRAFIDALAHPSTPIRTEARNPYKGLKAFHEADAPDFFGRDEAVASLLSLVDTGPFSLVVGPSGVGKSSAVRAGLIPALRAGALPGSENWLITHMLPGDTPIDELAASLRRISTNDPRTIVERLRSGDMSLLEAADRLFGGETALVVIDQLEEVYTHSPVERQDFLGILSEAARSSLGRMRVVATLRADYFDRPLEDAELGEAVQGRMLAMRALSPVELAEAIRRPAERVGIGVDDDLVHLMVEEAAAQPGALPLLQHSLAELFDRRTGDHLTLAMYWETGGLIGSIGRRAEQMYLELSPPARACARDAFLRLVTVDEEAEDARRRVRRAELEQLSYGPVLDIVLDAFGRGRMLTFDRDPASRSPTVELAHEAILQEWDRLAGWIEAGREDLLIRRRVDAAGHEWDESGREVSYLLSGGRLEQAERWRDETPLELTALEREFLTQSRLHAQELFGRRRRARRRVLAVLSAALLAVSTLALVALTQRRNAERTALENRTAELAGEAIIAMQRDPDLAILLALEAHRTSVEAYQRPPPEVVTALQQTVQASRLDMTLPNGREVIAVSPDGRHVAVDDADDRRRLVVYDIDTGSEVAGGRSPGIPREISYSPDGSTLAVMFEGPDEAPDIGDPTRSSAAVLLDATTLQPTLDLLGGPGPCCSSWSGDGRLYMTGGFEGPRVWDTTTGELAATLPSGTGRFVPGTDTVALERDGMIDLIDFPTGEVLSSVRVPVENTEFAISPDGSKVAFPDRGGRQVRVVDVESSSQSSVFGHGGPRTVRFSPDGHRVSVGGNADAVIVVDMESGGTTLLRGHAAGSHSHVFAPGGGRLLATMIDGGTRIWDITPDGPSELGNVSVGGASFFNAARPDGSLTSVYHVDADRFQAASIDLATGSKRVVADFWGVVYHWPAISPDGSLVAGFSPDERLASVVDVDTGETLLTLRPCETVKAIDSFHNSVLVDSGCAGIHSGQPAGEARRGFVDIRSNTLVHQIGPPIMYASYGIAGTASEDMAAFHDWNTITFVRPSTGETLGTWPIPYDTIPLFLTPSPDGTTIGMASQTGEAITFDAQAIADGVPLREAVEILEEATRGPNHQTLVTGDHLITSEGGSQIGIRDRESGKLIAEIPTESGGPAALLAFPDGSAVLYGDTDGVLRRFPLEVDALVDLARRRIQRGFTDAECDQYFQAGDCPAAD